MQTPEELAAQEAERERMLQESMQQEVVNIVLRHLEKQMDEFSARQKKLMNEIEKSLQVKFKKSEQALGSTIHNLQQYIDEVHSQQIADTEQLKKMAREAATVCNSGKHQDVLDKTKPFGLAKAEQDVHLQTSKDYLTLCREQQRID